MDKGVVGVSVTNVVIIGIIALIFVWGYDYIQKNWATSLPVL